MTLFKKKAIAIAALTAIFTISAQAQTDNGAAKGITQGADTVAAKAAGAAVENAAKGPIEKATKEGAEELAKGGLDNAAGKAVTAGADDAAEQAVKATTWWGRRSNTTKWGIGISGALGATYILSKIFKNKPPTPSLRQYPEKPIPNAAASNGEEVDVHSSPVVDVTNTESEEDLNNLRNELLLRLAREEQQ